MTLSLDDVRNKRFRMARKSGYEVLEVDEFVDEVEETFAQLIEENQNLKRQMDSLKQAPAGASAAAPAAQPATQAAQPQPQREGAPSGAIVVTTSTEASSAVVRLVQLSTEQAERLVNEANEDADRIRDEANRDAHEVTTDALTRAERVESEARVTAERLQADAMSRAEKVDREIETRRRELFGDLEDQRDKLSDAVNALRRFEAAYRANLTVHLRTQIEMLESGHAEPAEVPDVTGLRSGASGASGDGETPPSGDRDDAPTLGGGSESTSDTPRLDALLGDQR